jgi:hypothetical protein
MALDLNRIPFKQAKWFTEVSHPPRKIQLIVLHSMESPEKGTTAESVANYFANGADNRPASAHYCIDSNSIVQCVQCKDVAYGAPNANRNGIHLELAGYAKQTREEWLDDYGKLMLANAAALCAEILMPKFDILPVFIAGNALNMLRSRNSSLTGITTHAEVTKAFNPGGHWDPGPGFPTDYFMNLIKSHKQAIRE